MDQRAVRYTTAGGTAGYAVVVPARFQAAPGRRLSLGSESRPTVATYRRRRTTAAIFLASLVAVLGIATSVGLADRGGDPASVSTVRQARSYVVQPGDTLWDIASAQQPSGDLAEYVDALVSLNGGSSLQIGQVIALP